MATRPPDLFAVAALLHERRATCFAMRRSVGYSNPIPLKLAWPARPMTM